MICKTNEANFRWRMEYPDEKIVTYVEGTIHDNGPQGDQILAQIGEDAAKNYRFAVRFRETGYERNGSGGISFDGEYRAVATENSMVGAWFSPVGKLML